MCLQACGDTPSTVKDRPIKDESKTERDQGRAAQGPPMVGTFCLHLIHHVREGFRGIRVNMSKKAQKKYLFESLGVFFVLFCYVFFCCNHNFGSLSKR